MFENIGHFFKRMVKTEQQKELGSKDAAKERLHLVLMQDRANVSADFLELMKQEIIDVIKKYIVVDEDSIDVRLTNQSNDGGTNGAPALYANIPIVNIKNDMMAEKIKSFEGVDFNKEMGISVNKTNESVKENLEVPKVIELSSPVDSIPKKEEPINSISTEPENKEQAEEPEEVKEMFEEVDDDDDDDVTFDDLLKAAEAADKELKEKKDNEQKEENTSVSKPKTTRSSTKSKTKSSTKSKQKKK